MERFDLGLPITRETSNCNRPVGELIQVFWGRGSPLPGCPPLPCLAHLFFAQPTKRRATVPEDFLHGVPRNSSPPSPWVGVIRGGSWIEAQVQIGTCLRLFSSHVTLGRPHTIQASVFSAKEGIIPTVPSPHACMFRRDEVGGSDLWIREHSADKSYYLRYLTSPRPPVLEYKTVTYRITR